MQHSFELYPPRSDRVAAALPGVVARLAASGPAFFSVTYGAGGSTHDRSLDLVRHVLEHTDVEVMAHLTCVGRTTAESADLVRQFLDAGVRRFLAIRGDPPSDDGADGSGGAEGDLRTSAELVQLIHRVQAEREPYEERPVLGNPDVRWLHRGRRVGVAVAAFVNGHPGERRPRQAIDALLAKQAAGAELAITQIFFHAADYAAFVERARAAGVTIPIVPGIMPVTSPARLARTLELSGEDEPTELAIALEVEPTPEGRHEIGVAAAAELGRRLLEAGAPSLHLYTFNRADAVLAVLERLGLSHTPVPDLEEPA